MANLLSDAVSSRQPSVCVCGLGVRFEQQSGFGRAARAGIVAVKDVSFDIAPGECFGLVGESGCGKTTVGRAILRLLPAAVRVEGDVVFEGRSVLAAGGRQLGAFRKCMQIVFQDPGGSLNPSMRVGEAVAEPLLVHGVSRDTSELRRHALCMLDRCGIANAASALDRRPHEFSGGQRQRIAIARALVLRPRFLICDEPTSALDVSVQAQILNLLQDLKNEFGLTCLFISHDIGVVRHLCDRIAVMEKGSIIESAAAGEVVSSPRHPYTKALIAAVPRMRTLVDATSNALRDRSLDCT